MFKHLRSIKWENDQLLIIDQTLLPLEKKWILLDRLETVYEAIKKLRVRGAPAIGVVAAYGVVVGLKENIEFLKVINYLASSRPTAVNLFWALERMKKVYSEINTIENLLFEAEKIHKEDFEMSLNMGQFGNEIIPKNADILTHCNTGFLATGGIGTALSVIYTAHNQGKNPHVYVDETRPLLQGSRLTTWELEEAKIPATLISDNMAAHIMRTKKVDLVIVGADRITANGDVANKIGTYGLSILAKEHKIPFYVVAPSSTFDLSLENGDQILIEERESEEIKFIGNTQIAPKTVKTYNPAFDVTPYENITAIITEKGIINDFTEEKIKKHITEEI
jgi:methylthioribose-1-phosphate isomerase